MGIDGLKELTNILPLSYGHNYRPKVSEDRHLVLRSRHLRISQL